MPRKVHKDGVRDALERAGEIVRLPVVGGDGSLGHSHQDVEDVLDAQDEGFSRKITELIKILDELEKTARAAKVMKPYEQGIMSAVTRLDAFLIEEGVMLK